MSCVAVLDRYTSRGLPGRCHPKEFFQRSPGLIQWVSVSPMFRRRQPADADAFGAEVLGYLQPLYATALRLTRNRADAEDLVQDTLVKALRFSDRFERGTNLRAWLSTILHNTWRNRLRDAGREAAAVDVDSSRLEEAAAAADGPSGGETPEQLLLRNTLDADLRTALDELPDIFRQAVWLRDVEEFSYAEIAKMLDVPIGTVMSRISRGRRMLLEQLRKTRATA
jgi:RNA polymerase sigma-70 factor (ECF subfamily)